MKGQKNRTRITGLVMHVLIGGLLIITGSQKVIGSVPPKALVRYGLGEQAKLIAIGAILTALILVIPRTSSLGILLVSSFWGGAVCIHLAHGEPWLFQAAMLILPWAGACVRNPATIGSFSAHPNMTWDLKPEPEQRGLIAEATE
jgi:hypothetical protein